MTKSAAVVVCASLILGLLGVRLGLAQSRAPFRGLPWGPPPGPADPLEPWSLSSQAVAIPTPNEAAPPGQVGVVLPTPVNPDSPRDPRFQTPPESPIYGSDSTAVDAIPVVVLRQILIEDPHRARQLRDLFDAGVRWSAARPLLKLEDVPESVREFPLEDLANDILQEVESLPDSAWSSGRLVRGRTMFYQVVARRQRSRAALPALGEGLSEQERARLADLGPKLRVPEVSGLDNRDQESDPGLQQVTIVKQEPPVYPEAATIDGEVKLVVHIGRQGDVTDIEVASSTDPVFEQPAIDAARVSEYHSASRNGVPEPGIIHLTYTFRVPAADTSPPGEQP